MFEIMEVFGWGMLLFMDSPISFVQYREFISKAALSLETDGGARCRRLLDIWMTGEAMTEVEDAAGIFCWGDRKRCETSCILYHHKHIIFTIQYLLSTNPAAGKTPVGRLTPMLEDVMNVMDGVAACEATAGMVCWGQRGAVVPIVEPRGRMLLCVVCVDALDAWCCFFVQLSIAVITREQSW